MNWISVNDSLPIIPKGKFGIQVIVATFDKIYAELCPGKGYEVYQCSYGDIDDGRGVDFYTHAIGGKDIYVPCPTGNSVTHWMYLPEPPKETPSD